MASGDYFEVSGISGTGFTVHFKNSSNASIDRNFTYPAGGLGKGGENKHNVSYLNGRTRFYN